MRCRCWPSCAVRASSSASSRTRAGTWTSSSRTTALDVDAALSSGAFGRTKPHPTIFRAVLERLEVAAEDAAMVGDSLEDDIEGARAAGIQRAFLLDRENRFPEAENRLPDLFALPAALGLEPS